MKIVITNVTSANVNQVKALVAVGTNLVPRATRYVPDSDDLQCIRWRLEATGKLTSDVNLLLRFAHTLGKTYRNCTVTIQD